MRIVRMKVFKVEWVQKKEMVVKGICESHARKKARLKIGPGTKYFKIGSIKEDNESYFLDDFEDE